MSCPGRIVRMENDRSQFPFPYKPYDIQEQFMRALYRTLNQGKVGIFESPTGTVCLVDWEKLFAVVWFVKPENICVQCFRASL